MEIYYAGIGSRETPEDVCRKMFTAGRTLASFGLILRSGGARGADESFDFGALEYYNGRKKDGEIYSAISDSSATDATTPGSQIFLPFKGFNRHSSPLYGSTQAARAIAKKFHPRWDVLSCLGRDFHARNVYQILGPDLKTPSSFVLCWTPDGKVTGGTGQALRIAKDYEIPIINFATETDEYISDYILSQERSGQT